MSQVQHRWMGHAGQGGSTTTEQEKKMLIEPAVLGPSEELEKLFVRWSGRRSVMARIGRGAPGMLRPQMPALSQACSGEGCNTGRHPPGSFPGNNGSGLWPACTRICADENQFASKTCKPPPGGRHLDVRLGMCTRHYFPGKPWTGSGHSEA